MQQRRVRFEFPDDLRPRWHETMPEFSCAANSISLMMPYVEPYVVKAVRQTLPHLEGELHSEAQTYIAQEAQHHGEHQKFNAVIRAHVPGTALVERLLKLTFDRLWRKRSERFHLAYAAASEAVAYGAARWVERHHAELFRHADPEVTALYLWHLAEEVEHKNVAYDIYDARHGSRWPLAGAMIVSMMVLGTFAFVGTTIGLAHERRLHSPVAIGRLMKWSLSFLFSEFPNMVVSVLPGHHPSDFSDPTWFDLYLVDIERTHRPPPTSTTTATPTITSPTNAYTGACTKSCGERRAG